MNSRTGSRLALRASACLLLISLVLFTVATSARAQAGWGNALSLDDVDICVQVETFSLANSSFPIEAWARRDSSDTMNFIVGQGTRSTRIGLHLGYHQMAGNLFVVGFYNDYLLTAESSRPGLRGLVASIQYHANGQEGAGNSSAVALPGWHFTAALPFPEPLPGRPIS